MTQNKIRRVSLDPAVGEEGFTEVLKYTGVRGPYAHTKNHFEVKPGEVFCTDKATAKYLLETLPDLFEESEVIQKKVKKAENKAQKPGDSENKGA